MYLRNLIDYNKHELNTKRSFKAAGIVLFALILIIAFIASSLTEKESDAILNNRSSASAVTEYKANLNSITRHSESNGYNEFSMQVFFVKVKVLSKI